MIVTCTSCSLVLGESDVQCNIICSFCLNERRVFWECFNGNPDWHLFFQVQENEIFERMRETTNFRYSCFQFIRVEKEKE